MTVKRLILFIIISLLITGCEKNVTNDMFVGHWLCQPHRYDSNWNGSSFDEYKEVDSFGKEIRVAFKDENGQIYAKQDNETVWRQQDMSIFFRE